MYETSKNETSISTVNMNIKSSKIMMTANDYFKVVVFRRLENIFQTCKGLEFNLAGRYAQEAMKKKGATYCHPEGVKQSWSESAA